MSEAATQDAVKGTELENENQDLEKVDPPVNEDQETEQEETKDTEGHKKKSTFARRAEKVRREREELLNEVNYWKRAALEKTSPTEHRSAEPQLENFDTVQEFIKARDEWLEERLLAKVQDTVKKTTVHDRTLEAHNARVEKAKQELPDWDEVFDEVGDLDVAPDTAQFVLESPVGPRIAYHLAKNPDVLEKLNRLSPTRRLAELGKLEDKVATPKQPKKVSDAPTKLTIVKGNDSRDTSARPSSYAEWKAKRGK